MTQPKRDQEFFSRLERILDEQFPKIEEEGPEKKANRRGAALVLFAEANRIHSEILALVNSYEAKGGYCPIHTPTNGACINAEVCIAKQQGKEEMREEAMKMCEEMKLEQKFFYDRATTIETLTDLHSRLRQKNSDSEEAQRNTRQLEWGWFRYGMLVGIGIVCWMLTFAALWGIR